MKQTQGNFGFPKFSIAEIKTEGLGQSLL